MIDFDLLDLQLLHPMLYEFVQNFDKLIDFCYKDNTQVYAMKEVAKTFGFKTKQLTENIIGI